MTRSRLTSRLSRLIVLPKWARKILGFELSKMLVILDARKWMSWYSGIQDIERSGLFDRDFYAHRYPDSEKGTVKSISHYVIYGASQGYDPNILFSTSEYLQNNPDVKACRYNPFAHFIRFGAAEGRRASQFFDTRLYLKNTHDLSEIPTNPLSHYLNNGGLDGKQSQRLLEEQITRNRSSKSESPSSSEVAIVLHLYYPNIWPEIEVLLQQLDFEFDLFITIPKFCYSQVFEDVLRTFERASIFLMDNHGRDILPFMKLLQAGKLDTYKFVCKLHSKRSLHRADGNRWRGDLYEALIGSTKSVLSIVKYFEEHEDIGIIGPSNYLFNEKSVYYFGSNQRRVADLIQRLGGSDSEKYPFFAGSMFWFRPKALQGLLSLKLKPEDFEREQAQIDGTLAHALERIFLASAIISGFRIAHTDEAYSSRSIKLTTPRIGDREFKLIAFYLPQFHPIPENDKWWGKGFTEWTNVTKAKPLFDGHMQPKLPTDLGFYDLRLPESREAQAKLALEYGITGFCYYYYWFNGRKLLDRPIREVLNSGQPNFPFCICWANENWTRRWDGLENQILMKQEYADGFDMAFIDDVIPYMRDDRYIRYNNKPVLLVYRIKAIPNIRKTVEVWRKRCRQLGLGEIHLCAVRFHDVHEDVCEYGFDAALNFPPHQAKVKNVAQSIGGLTPDFKGLIYDYRTVVEGDLSAYRNGYDRKIHRALMMGWDNTARRGANSHIAYGATPELYGNWLQGIIEQELQYGFTTESLVFINAWNEWAEGTTLEPDNHFGTGYLRATREKILEIQSFGEQP